MCGNAKCGNLHEKLNALRILLIHPLTTDTAVDIGLVIAVLIPFQTLDTVPLNELNAFVTLPLIPLTTLEIIFLMPFHIELVPVLKFVNIDDTLMYTDVIMLTTVFLMVCTTLEIELLIPF